MNTLLFTRASSRRLTNLPSITTYNSLNHLLVPSSTPPPPPAINQQCPLKPQTCNLNITFLRSFHGSQCASVRPTNVSTQSAGYAVAANQSYDDRASHSDGLEISKLGINQEIVTALAKKGITKLFPIQRAVLEPAMQGRDMIGRARTGTGKTLAFGIPIMDKIIQYNEKHGRGRNPLAIVMAPTRELARQVEKEFYESAPNLDTLCVYGGSPIQRQMSTLDRGVDVIVGTPGRVIDLLKRGALNLSEVKFAVLDEADQMLNVGFAEDVETILEYLPKQRQTMMFSATMPSWIVKLTHKYLKAPLTIDLVGDSDQKLAVGITLYSISSEMRERPSIIGPLITDHANGGKCIVFTQTKRDADRLAYALQRSFRCEALHGDISQNQRERTLSGFRDGRFNVLVATDVAARGLDVPNVDLVIHYELPNSSEIFVHRSGRTGRAGKKGSAILMYSSQQWRDVKAYEREVGCKFTEVVNPSDVIILEGILIFHDPYVREMMNMKIFVDTDVDVRLERRIRRDTGEKGRDISMVLDQYSKFVKPAFDDFILPAKKYANIIIPRGGDKHVAIDLIVQHIRTKLGQPDLCKINPNLYVIHSTFQIRGMHTLIRDAQTTKHDFVFYADRLIRLVVEHGLGHLPFTEKQVVTPTESVYTGVDFCKRLCGVSIIRSGESMENALRACCKGIKIGKILIHREGDNGQQLIYEKLPQDISDRHVLLLDPILGTGNSAVQAISLLLKKGVPEANIIFLNLISAPQGVHVVCRRFPRIKIVTSEIETGLNQEFRVLPGMGEFGDRYFGTDDE